jgi:hypothetical protein
MTSEYEERKRLTFEQAEGAEPLPSQLKLRQVLRNCAQGFGGFSSTYFEKTALPLISMTMGMCKYRWWLCCMTGTSRVAIGQRMILHHRLIIGSKNSRPYSWRVIISKSLAFCSRCYVTKQSLTSWRLKSRMPSASVEPLTPSSMATRSFPLGQMQSVVP